MTYNDLIPELGVLDIEASLRFYTQTLPFKIEYQRQDVGFAFLSLGNSQLMLEQVSATDAATDEELRAGAWRTGALEYPLGRGMNLEIRVESLDQILLALANANYPLKMQPREAWYRRETILIGQRQILVMDPDGYLLRFHEVLGERPAD
ncbi:MAG: VOC family protein [Deltaproteobacteria bacterium]|nr:VOC family protein [Deltaproteobacteria bacterium]MBI3386925.1 VOC family protein [Deltaproteobacteria bacterium]